MFPTLVLPVTDVALVYRIRILIDIQIVNVGFRIGIRHLDNRLSEISAS